MTDAVVVGGGPAGLACGMHLARAGVRTLLLERDGLGGQARHLGRIENYPGFPSGVRGSTLMRQLALQARRQGLKMLRDEVLAVSRTPRGFIVRLAGMSGPTGRPLVPALSARGLAGMSGPTGRPLVPALSARGLAGMSGPTGRPLVPVRLRRTGARRRALRCRAVVVCAGSAFRELGVPGERRLAGRGVHHGSWEGPGRRRGPVAVVGGGDAAVHQALALARRGARVRLIHRGPALRAVRPLLARLAARRDVGVFLGAAVRRVLGRERVEAVEVEELRTGRRRLLKVSALFVLVGKRPPRWPRLGRREGLFRAGDLNNGPFRQIAIAVGDGMRAAMACARYLQCQ